MQHLRSTTWISCALLGLLGGCRLVSHRAVAPDYPPLESSELGGMHNVSVSGIVWIGSVPSATDLDLAQRRGIERVIDLSAGDARPRYDLSAACERLGLTCVEIGLRAKDEIPDDAVDCVVRLLGQDDAPKTLLFCEDGSTAALFLAIHRVVTEGVSLERALLEARRCGMASGPPEELVRTHVARLSRDR